MKCYLVCFFLATIISCTKGANILGVFPLAGKSVNYLYQKLMKGLADAGHNIIYVSAYEFELTLSNGSVRDVMLKGFAKEFEDIISELDLEQAGMEATSLFKSNHHLNTLLDIYNKTFHHLAVQRLIKTKPKFDLVITEYLFSKSLLGFAKFFKCPSVVLSSMGGVDPFVNNMVGNYLPPSYVPHPFILGDFSEGLQFFDRFCNFLFYTYDHIFNYFFSFPAHNELLKSVFKKNPPNAAELFHNVSLVLLGSHPSIRQAIPLVPNVKEIGGFHIDPPEELPTSLKKFLDNAQNGAIFFSMGTIIQSKNFSDEKKRTFLKVFEKLDMKVIWKYEDDVLPGRPPNVIIGPWFPQMEILSHPNLKLFINHGGYSSIIETVYTGTPALLIPVFGDQFNNAYQAQEQGYALKLSYNDKNFNEETLFALLKELLENSKYTDKAQAKSKLFHDRPTKPLEEAVYWIEYVIRHNGADHLKVAGMKLPLYQFYMLDVIFVFFIALLFVVLALYVFIRSIWRRKPTTERKIKTN